MTDRFNAIRAAEAKATPGPWAHEQDQPEFSRIASTEGGDVAHVGMRFADGDFIALAREAVPALLAMRDALLAQHVSTHDDGTPCCDECHRVWPCNTVRLLEGEQA